MFQRNEGEETLSYRHTLRQSKSDQENLKESLFVKQLGKTYIPVLNHHQNSGFPFPLIAQKGEMGDLSVLT